jgi:large subunit ribosomal protein L4
VTTVDILDASGNKSGTVELPAEIFDVQVNIPLIHQVVVAQQAAARQGTHDTKSRGEVRGGGRKPYKQKGTGRARQGSRTAPHYRGGGAVFGPHPRSYEQRLPRKMRRAALRGALTAKLGDEAIRIIDTFALEGFKTSDVATILAALNATGRIIVVAPATDEQLWRSARNLPTVDVIRADSLNVVDLINADTIVIEQPALARIEEVYL